LLFPSDAGIPTFRERRFSGLGGGSVEHNPTYAIISVQLPPMPAEWNLNYPSWMIEDGTPDREIGDSFEWFAIEFWTVKESLVRTDEHLKSAVPIADYNYRVLAELVYLSDKACVIDFGLRAICAIDALSPGCKEGDYLTGQIGIGLPLSTQMVPEEVLRHLAHKWRVKAVSADLTPYVAEPKNSRFYVRDITRIQYQEVQSTKTIKTHNYVLHCSEIG
jgi:hypothetical protein